MISGATYHDGLGYAREVRRRPRSGYRPQGYDSHTSAESGTEHPLSSHNWFRRPVCVCGWIIYRLWYHFSSLIYYFSIFLHLFVGSAINRVSAVCPVDMYVYFLISPQQVEHHGDTMHIYSRYHGSKYTCSTELALAVSWARRSSRSWLNEKYTRSPRSADGQHYLSIPRSSMEFHAGPRCSVEMPRISTAAPTVTMELHESPWLPLIFSNGAAVEIHTLP